MLPNNQLLIFPNVQRLVAACLSILSVAMFGCSKVSVALDPWEAAKIAYQAKKVIDIRNNLISLGSGGYALKLVSECKSDETKCIEAFEILRLGFAMTDGEDSLGAAIACQFGAFFTVDYLSGIEFEIATKYLDGVSTEDEHHRLDKQLAKIHELKQSALNKCGKKLVAVFGS